MRTRIPCLALVLALGASAAPAAELRVYPPDVALSGPAATQQLLVMESADGRATADHTATARFVSDQPGVATVDDTGVVRAVGDGTATVTAEVGSQSTTVTVRVSGLGGNTAPGFRNHVQAVLTRTGCNSGACHGALAGKGGFKLSLRGYNPEADHFALTRQALARRVDVADPDDSLLLKKATRAVPHGGGTRFDDDTDHYRVLRDWIAAGAPSPRPEDPTLTRIEVFPTAALIRPQGKTRLIVRAVYSDGGTADVTRWAKFASSEEQAATVDEDGVITGVGYGEAGVAAIFDSKVAVATVTSPFPNAVEPRVFAEAPRENFIDDLVLRKLRLLNLPPSPPCSDSEFVRRVYLDTCGVLPTPEEAKAFLDSTDPHKRDRLIDSLLNRPEYVDYWSHKWSDLLLVSTRKLPPPAMWAMYRFVRRSVADNQSWDRFARDVLTASGSSWASGGGNYFVIHKDVTEVAEATAMTFLGTAIGCAKCHNHPLEKWTQDQYWSFANLFARVGLKDGPRKDEVIVQSLPTGDALHPRSGVPVPPAPLDGPSAHDGVDRRRHLADWMTDPANPLFAKNVVNRVWKNFMGRGLVEAEDDLRDTNPASNPELLDALTRDFVDHGYDIKHLIRMILRSETYRRSSEPLPENVGDDRFYSRYLIRRLQAETILDAYSDVVGVATPFDVVSLGPTGGTRNTADYPAGTRAMQLPDTLLVSRFLDAFGRPERQQACACERTADATVTQALHLNNGQTLNDKLRDPKSRVSRWLADKLSDEEIVDRVFWLALCRAPRDGEKASLIAVLGEAAAAGPDAHREGVEDVFWAVLTGKEFLFNH